MLFGQLCQIFLAEPFNTLSVVSGNLVIEGGVKFGSGRVIARRDPFARHAGNHRIIWELFSFIDNTVASDDTVVTDFHTVHQRGVDTNQAIVPDRATVNRAVVSNRTVITNDRWRCRANMDHHEILDIRILTNLDFEHLGSHHDMRPNRTTLTNGHLPVNQRTVVQKGKIIERDVRSNVRHVVTSKANDGVFADYSLVEHVIIPRVPRLHPVFR